MKQITFKKIIPVLLFLGFFCISNFAYADNLPLYNERCYKINGLEVVYAANGVSDFANINNETYCYLAPNDALIWDGHGYNPAFNEVNAYNYFPISVNWASSSLRQRLYISTSVYNSDFNNRDFILISNGFSDTSILGVSYNGTTDIFTALQGASVGYSGNVQIINKNTVSTSTATSTNGCVLGVCSNGTTTITAYPTVDSYPCSTTELLGCIKQGLTWAFIPSREIFDDFSGLVDQLRTKAPIGYVSSFIGVFSQANSSSTLSLGLLPEDAPLYILVFKPVRVALVIIFFLFGAVWLFRRLKDINI